MMFAIISPCFSSIPKCPSGQNQNKTNQSYPYSKSTRLVNNRSSVVCYVTNEVSRKCECFDLYNKVVPYKEAWNWQKDIVRQKKDLIVKDGDCSDTLIVLQHSPVYTLGTSSSEEFLNFDIKNAPFDVYRTERGGEVTYHGPGQILMYPILNLRNHHMDLHWYLRALEEVVIRVLSSTFSIKASRVKGLTGVWVGERKLAAVGIRVSKWISYHGLALNVSADLTPFQRIIPCGIRNRRVSSVKEVLREFEHSVRSEDVDSRFPSDDYLIDITHKSLIKEFSEVFQLEIHTNNTSTLDFWHKELNRASSHD